MQTKQQALTGTGYNCYILRHFLQERLILRFPDCFPAHHIPSEKGSTPFFSQQGVLVTCSAAHNVPNVRNKYSENTVNFRKI